MTTNMSFQYNGVSSFLQNLGLFNRPIITPVAMTTIGREILLATRLQRVAECRFLVHNKVDVRLKEIDKMLGGNCNVVKPTNCHQNKISEGSAVRIKLTDEKRELLLFVDHFIYPHSVFPIISLTGEQKDLRGKQQGDYGLLGNHPYQILEILPDDSVFEVISDFKNKRP